MKPVMVRIREEYLQKGEEVQYSEPMLLIGVVPSTTPYESVPCAIVVDKGRWIDSVPLNRVVVDGAATDWPLAFIKTMDFEP